MHYRQYRDSSRHADSPAKPPPPVATAAPSLLDSIDHVNNHGGGGYADDRVQNDLLKEICGDIGLDEAMDLDIFDFQMPADSLFYGGGTDRTSTSLDFDGIADLNSSASLNSTLVVSGAPSSSHSDTLTSSNSPLVCGTPSGGIGSFQTKLPGSALTISSGDMGEKSPYAQSVPSVTSDSQRDAAIDSPTVSSSVQSLSDGSLKSNQALNGSSGGGGSSRPTSTSSGSLGSPSVHSTTSFPPLDAAGAAESIKPPSVASHESSSALGSSGGPRSVGSSAAGRDPSPVTSQRGGGGDASPGRDKLQQPARPRRCDVHSASRVFLK